MKKTFIILTFCVFSAIVNAQKAKHYIFFYDPVTSMTENDQYEKTKDFFDLNKQYNNIKNANVDNEVNTAISHKDFKLIAVNEKVFAYPGVEKKDEAYLKQYKFKVVQGTGFAVKGNTLLQKAATDFAKKYNKKLLGKISEVAKGKH